ncbi:MAG: hypothetical protein HUU32_23590 [Calditrichaceae bacterium]|nr:hypothetical protein [Calditrichaceae bacterium]
MPIRAEEKNKYPENWKEIRKHILGRAKRRCEWCGVPDHAVGYRNEKGKFIRNGGNIYCDRAGWGELDISAAREMVKHYNDWCPDGNHWIIIILTIAHLDHNPANNDPANLAALCQQCHNRYDAKKRQRNRRARLFKDQLSFPL